MKSFFLLEGRSFLFVSMSSFGEKIENKAKLLRNLLFFEFFRKLC